MFSQNGNPFPGEKGNKNFPKRNIFQDQTGAIQYCPCSCQFMTGQQWAVARKLVRIILVLDREGCSSGQIPL